MSGSEQPIYGRKDPGMDYGRLGAEQENTSRQTSKQANPQKGSKHFLGLLREIEHLHSIKSYDYASSENPHGNYLFAGETALKLFAHSGLDLGFMSRLCEKLYRISNLEKNNKIPNNETIEVNEDDIATIVVLWMSARREARDRKAYHTYGPAVRQSEEQERAEKHTRQLRALDTILKEIEHLDMTLLQQLESYLPRYISDKNFKNKNK